MPARCRRRPLPRSPSRPSRASEVECRGGNGVVDVAADAAVVQGARAATTTMKVAAAKKTILGFGSLMSEQSARTTFPDLEGFRLVKVEGYRRVFAHAAAIFFEREIANKETKEFSSLSAEPCAGASFVACCFEVDLDETNWATFEAREEEFDLRSVPFAPLDESEAPGEGVLCCRGSDAKYIERWGRELYESKYAPHVPSIWDWEPTSGLRPCACTAPRPSLAV